MFSVEIKFKAGDREVSLELSLIHISRDRPRRRRSRGVNPAMPKGVCAMPYNLTDYRLALDRWVKDGTPARCV